MTQRDFHAKVVLISGAAGGLGAALCRRFVLMTGEFDSCMVCTLAS